MANERRNTTQPTDWWAAWEEAAKAAGLDLAAWIGEQCNKALPKKVREKLVHPREVFRPAIADAVSLRESGLC